MCDAGTARCRGGRPPLRGVAPTPGAGAAGAKGEEEGGKGVVEPMSLGRWSEGERRPSSQGACEGLRLFASTGGVGRVAEGENRGGGGGGGDGGGGGAQAADAIAAAVVAIAAAVADANADAADDGDADNAADAAVAAAVGASSDRGSACGRRAVTEAGAAAAAALAPTKDGLTDSNHLNQSRISPGGRSNRGQLVPSLAATDWSRRGTKGAARPRGRRGRRRGRGGGMGGGSGGAGGSGGCVRVTVTTAMSYKVRVCAGLAWLGLASSLPLGTVVRSSTRSFDGISGHITAFVLFRFRFRFRFIFFFSFLF